MSSTLILGDCLDKLSTIPDGSVDMVFADLPYGVTANKWDAVIPFDRLWAELRRVGKPNAAFIFTATQPFATALICSQPKLFRYDLVWEKSVASGFMNANRMPLRAHESILIFYRKLPCYHPQKTPGKSYTARTADTVSKNYGDDWARRGGVANPSGLRAPRSVLKLANSRGLHPTQKPVALLEWLVKTYSNEGDTVLDPVMGSGTTGVACANTGRKFIGIEKDPTYFQTCESRIAAAKVTP